MSPGLGGFAAPQDWNAQLERNADCLTEWRLNKVCLVSPSALGWKIINLVYRSNGMSCRVVWSQTAPGVGVEVFDGPPMIRTSMPFSKDRHTKATSAGTT